VLLPFPPQVESLGLGDAMAFCSAKSGEGFGEVAGLLLPRLLALPGQQDASSRRPLGSRREEKARAASRRLEPRPQAAAPAAAARGEAAACLASDGGEPEDEDEMGEGGEEGEDSEEGTEESGEESGDEDEPSSESVIEMAIVGR
jgi:hypothetical protein